MDSLSKNDYFLTKYPAMTADYWFDVILTIPDWMVSDLPVTPEPIVSFMHDDYINNYRYKPTEPIISEAQLRAFLEDNGIETDKCMIMQKPRVNEFEAIINGNQVYRIHWVIECEFDEEKCVVIIPKEARLFLDEVHKVTHENSLTILEITHSIAPWEDSWIHKRISYSEFKAHALCNEADALLESIDGTIKEVVDKNIKDIKIQMNKSIETLRDSIYRQHGALLKDVNSFKDRMKKSISVSQKTINYEHIIEDLTKKNAELVNEIKNNKLYLSVMIVVQISMIALLMFHFFTFR